VVVDHGYGLTTYYGHLSTFSVLAGEQLRRGDAIGNVGVSGRSTGPHVHYEVRINGAPVNPCATCVTLLRRIDPSDQTLLRDPPVLPLLFAPLNFQMSGVTSTRMRTRSAVSVMSAGLAGFSSMYSMTRVHRLTRSSGFREPRVQTCAAFRAPIEAGARRHPSGILLRAKPQIFPFGTSGQRDPLDGPYEAGERCGLHSAWSKIVRNQGDAADDKHGRTVSHARLSRAQDRRRVHGMRCKHGAMLEPSIIGFDDRPKIRASSIWVPSGSW